MAYYYPWRRNRWNRRYFPRTRRTWRRRTTRRTYRRRNPRRRVSWRRLYRTYRRRRFAVKQYQPLYRKRCTITAILPLLFVRGGLNAVNDFMMPATGLINFWMGGGCDSGSITMNDLYWEERFWRARWSTSNQGFDLFRYFGVKLTLWPNSEYSYIFWWSTEELSEDKEPLTVCHPSQLLLTKQHVVVEAWRQKGKRLPRIIKVKPPTSILQAWWHIKDAANKPLLKWRVSLIDLENPWTGFPNNNTYCVRITVWGWKTASEAGDIVLYYHPLLDDGTGIKVFTKELQWNNNHDGPALEQPGQSFWPAKAQFEELLVPFYLFCYGRSAEYYSNLQQYHRPAPQTANNGYFQFIMLTGTRSIREENGGLPTHKDNMYYIKYSTMQLIAANGPWTEKSVYDACNISMKCKFFFQWGGTPGTQLPPVQPGEGGPVWPKSTIRWPGSLRADIRDPTKGPDEVLKAEDLDSDGIITRSAFARITKSDFSSEDEAWLQKKKIWGSVQHQGRSGKRKRGLLSSSSEEEETSHDSSTSEDEEAPQAEEKPARRQHRHRRKLRKLVQLLDRIGWTGTSKTVPSGRLKSHSI
ncbi:hypothetical protein QKK92_gp2 [Mosquito VEM Anellovirus SDRB A]|uniref:Capsid protein n=1 Tax=Mosquito VEM Anellovirus SDRB A TaxID=1034792 RepID=F6KID5_9VIRU|nr:hypothetical protein QKK92_gp2 [Mosquito VEM Anellovirus SDRB A]AEF58766.1 hypothetical protein [Mosquito VEM Anellovirus SDRB A]